MNAATLLYLSFLGREAHSHQGFIRRMPPGNRKHYKAGRSCAAWGKPSHSIYRMPGKDRYVWP